MQDDDNQPHTERSQQLNAIKDFLQSQKPLMLIVGEKNSGKTNLLTDIILQVRASRHIIRVQGHPNLHPSQLTKVLSKHWTVENIDKDQRIETQLDQMLDGLTEHHQACILIIDDAHLLSLSVLAALTHLATQQDGKPTPLHLLLSGHAALSEKMNSLQTRDIPQLIVGALSRKDAFQKIKLLFDDAGISLPPADTDAILANIYQRSAGMHETLEHTVEKMIAHQKAMDSSAKAITSKYNIWKNHRVKMLSLLGLSITFFVLFQMQGHSLKTLVKNNAIVKFASTKLKFQNKKHKLNTIKKSGAIVLASAEKKSGPPILANTTKKYETVVLASTEKKSEPPILASTTKKSEAIALTNAEKKSEATALASMTKELEAAILAKTARKPKKTVTLASTTQKTPPPTEKFKYTLQLMSGANEKALKEFINRHHLERIAAAVKMQYKGRDWYILTYGHYKSPRSAKQALKKLPKPLQKLHPWIRPDGVLHSLT